MSRCPTCEGTVCTSSPSSSSSSIVPNCLRLVNSNPEIFLKKLVEVTKERDGALEQREKYEAFLGELSNKFEGITGRIDKLHTRVDELESTDMKPPISPATVEVGASAVPTTEISNGDNPVLPTNYPPTDSIAPTYSKDWDEDCDDLIDSDLEEAAEATTQRWMHANTPIATNRPNTNANKDGQNSNTEDDTFAPFDKPPSKDIISGYVNGVKSKGSTKSLLTMVEEIKKARTERYNADM